MGKSPSDDHRASRIDRLVRRLLSGRRLRLKASDADDREAIMAAARLAGSREARPHMSPALRRRLAAQLGAEPPEAPSWVTRRTALTGAVGLAAGLLATVGGEQVLRALQSTPAPPPATPTPPLGPTPRPVFAPNPGNAHWSDTGLRLADLAEGVPRRVAAGAVDALVVRRQDKVSAMSAYCTHFPCELVWKSADHVLLCPCHNQTFSSDGVSTDPAYPLPPLPLVEVRLNNGRVEVLGT
jgi:nitrite reductase/ring-hydroxylating ferredoxin subunit